MTGIAEATYRLPVTDPARAVLERARNRQVYTGHISVLAAMSDLDRALKAGRTTSTRDEAENLVRVVREHCGDDAAAYVSGSEGGE